MSPSRPFRNVLSIICSQTLMYMDCSTENKTATLKTATTVWLLSLAANDGRIFYFSTLHILWLCTDFESEVLKVGLTLHVVELCAKSWPGSWDLAGSLVAWKKVKRGVFQHGERVWIAPCHWEAQPTPGLFQSMSGTKTALCVNLLPVAWSLMIQDSVI